MKIIGIRSILVGSLMLITGCGPQAQQAAPQLIVRGIAKLSGAKKGFFITNGRPSYHDWNAGVGNIDVPLADADAASFHAFDQQKQTKALFARDRNHVYMAEQYTPREIQGADPKSFELITSDGLYAKDVKHVYYLGVPIVAADPLTFEVLMYPFSQDEEHAFIGAAPIPGVERQSWRPLRSGWTENPWDRTERGVQAKVQKSVYVFGWSRDADKFYYGREALPGIDVATFEVLSDYYAKDTNHVYSRHYNNLAIIVGADPATFIVHQDADDIVSPRADAHDANSQYRRGKVY